MSNLNNFQPASGFRYQAKTAIFALAASDTASYIDCTSGTFAVTSAAANTLGPEFVCILRNSGTGVITGPTADGSTFTLYTGDSAILQGDGAALHVTKIKSPDWVLFSTTTITNGTVNVPITSIPLGYNNLRVDLDSYGHTSGGLSNLLLEISTTNGSSWGATQAVSSNITSGSTTNAVSIAIDKYSGDLGLVEIGQPSSANVSISANGTFGATRHTGGMNAFRLSFSTGNFSQGTLKVWLKV